MLGAFRRIRGIAKGEFLLRHVRPSVRLSAWNNSAPTRRIVMKFDISVFFRKFVEKKIQVLLKSVKNVGHFT